jgi:ABC-type phosphate transport system permease subunit
MARPWERLFIALARLCAWCVILTPFGIVSVLVIAALAGQQQPDKVFFLGNVVVQLFATVLVAVTAGATGASIGIGASLLTRELVSMTAARPILVACDLLCAVPSVVIGWFGALLVLPALAGQAAVAVFIGAIVVVTIAVIPRAYAIASHVLAGVGAEVRASAAAAGADPSRIAAHVTLPSVRRHLTGIYLDAFARGVGEAAAVTVVFLAAARAGYPVALFTIPSSIMAHARTAQVIDAGLAQSALLILALAAVSKTVALRRIGGVRV